MTPPQISSLAEEGFRRIVETCFRQEAGASAPFPDETTDLIETGILDSMGWVSFLRAVETASGISLGSGLNEQPSSIAAIMGALQDSMTGPSASNDPQMRMNRAVGTSTAFVAASSSVLGAKLVSSEEVDRAFGMPVGKLRQRAGIESLAYAAADENELTLGRVVGEFGGLFGDGASAFVLRRDEDGRADSGYCVGGFLFGCAGQYASAIRVAPKESGGLDVQFDGEALSRAAITRLEKVIAVLETRSGIARGSVGGFATHQPNPRLVAVLAKQIGVSPETFPAICRTSGNLGSSMCGAALHAALQQAAKAEFSQRKPIFLASLGPGMLLGGTWLTAASSGGAAFRR